MKYVGTRVIRGPDWPGGNEDGGEGSLGTVVNAYDSAGKVKVMWDFGGHGIYKAGTEKKHELYIYDNGPTGVIHTSVTCDGACKGKTTTPLSGLRWKCRQCEDFDLCTRCFMDQTHNQEHKFLRQTTPSTTVCSIGNGDGRKIITLHGILPGASVTRGVDWESGNEDGGKKNEGIVEKLTKWGATSYNGSALVKWVNGFRTNYRVGGDGCVDLLCIGESRKYKCVPACLPVLDILHSHGELKIGDKVQMITDVAILKQVLTEIENWDSAIEKYVDKEGTIVRIHDRMISLQYHNTQTWHLLRSLLIKKHSFKRKDFVRIINQSTAKMEKLQEGHGNWVEDMEQTKGKIGQVIEVCDDGDLKVQVKDLDFYYSPVCCSPIEKCEIPSDELKYLESHSMISSTSSSSSLTTSSVAQLADFDEIEDDTENALAQILQMPLASQGLVAAAAQNDIDGLEAILLADKSQVDIFIKGKTALQMACSKGHEEIVQYLLSNGAKINLPDEEGDAPIHFAADGKHFQIVKLLHSSGANINLKNNKNQTAFHLAVIREDYATAEFLMNNNCDINTQDESGDCPLHDAVNSDDKDKKILHMILSSKHIKVDIINNNGITPVHLAVINHLPDRIFHKMVAKKDNIDSLRTSVGKHTPLHVAAINANNALAMFLVKQRKCNVNAKDADGRTPLHLAVIQKSEPMVDLLLSADAEINCQDKDGNTPAHLSALDIHLDESVYSKSTGHLGNERKFDVTYVLTQFGADLEMKNKQGKSVLDLVSGETKGILKRVMLSVKKRTPSTRDELSMYPLHWEPMETKEGCIKVEIKDDIEGVTDEYREVVKHFLKTGNRKPVKVERIQNIDRWEAYMTKKRSMQRSSKFDVNEKSLFHGTKPDVVNQILHQGLDMRLVENGLYGDGCYFATESRISEGYTMPDHNGFRYMFICKVLCGKYTQGTKKMRKPPPIDESDPNVMYDSAVNNEDRPNIFVIFDNAQCYPEYLITYA